MKILESVLLDDANMVVDKTQDKSQRAKERVFYLVKKLFHLTSNKKLVLGQYAKKKALYEQKIQRSKVITAKINATKEKLSSSLESLAKEYEKAKNLLRQSLEGEI